MVSCAKIAPRKTTGTIFVIVCLRARNASAEDMRRTKKQTAAAHNASRPPTHAVRATLLRALRTRERAGCAIFSLLYRGAGKTARARAIFSLLYRRAARSRQAARHSKNRKVHFPRSEACRLRQRQALARRPAPPGGAGRENGRLKDSPPPTGGTEAKKSHALWPQKRTGGTEAKKSHSVPAHTDAQACTQVRGRAIKQKPASPHMRKVTDVEVRAPRARGDRFCTRHGRPAKCSRCVRGEIGEIPPTGVSQQAAFLPVDFCPPGRS